MRRQDNGDDDDDDDDEDEVDDKDYPSDSWDQDVDPLLDDDTVDYVPSDPDPLKEDEADDKADGEGN